MNVDEIEKREIKAELRLAIAELRCELLIWMICVQLAFGGLIWASVWVFLTHWKP
jgi:hypothetical protein